MASSHPAAAIGAYYLGDVIGEGAFGTVRVGRHKTLGTKVAVKEFSLAKIRLEKMDERVQREIKIMKILRHPHIVSLYEVIKSDTHIYLVIEYVSGGELFNYIVDSVMLDEDEARSIFQQMVSGIDYCHKHMIVHRDLKPENVLFDQLIRKVQIADFGLSNFMSVGSFLESSVGSPNYAAPEIVTGSLYAGPEVDVWSCGVILYAMLCGCLPFDDDTVPGLYRKISTATYDIPDHVSASAADLIRRILVVNPLRRYTLRNVQDHPWFGMDIPGGLTKAVSIDFEDADIDEEAVDEVMARIDGVDRETLIRSLVANTRTNDTIAYHLIKDTLDKRRFLDESTRSLPLRSMSSPTSLLHRKRRRRRRGSPVVGTRRVTRQRRPAMMAASVARISDDVPEEGASFRWTLGLVSYKLPQSIFDVCYDVFTMFGWTWKVGRKKWTLLVRTAPPKGSATSTLHSVSVVSRSSAYDQKPVSLIIANHHCVIMEVHLFKRDVTGCNQLDVRLVSGNPCVFLDAANKAIAVIKGRISARIVEYTT